MSLGSGTPSALSVSVPVPHRSTTAQNAATLFEKKSHNNILVGTTLLLLVDFYIYIFVDKRGRFLGDPLPAFRWEINCPMLYILYMLYKQKSVNLNVSVGSVLQGGGRDPFFRGLGGVAAVSPCWGRTGHGARSGSLGAFSP